MKPMKLLCRTAITSAVVGLMMAGSAISAGVAAPLGTVGDSSASSQNLFVRYDTTSPCTVYLNYPKPGVTGNSAPWTIPVGRKKVIWRYNVNAEWALVSDPARSATRTFPWWGFTRRNCIKDEPRRILEGRSNVNASGWRRVSFNLPSAHVIARHRKVTHNATLRDPANFVIGNVPAEWHVDVTNKTRSNGYWVEVYVPNAKRWGYIESSKLR